MANENTTNGDIVRWHGGTQTSPTGPAHARRAEKAYESFTGSQLSSELLRRHDRMVADWLVRLISRSQGVLRGDMSAADAEREQQGDDAELVALRRLSDRLVRRWPLV